MRIHRLLSPLFALGLAGCSGNPLSGVLGAGSTSLSPQLVAISDTSAQGNTAPDLQATWSQVSTAQNYRVVFNGSDGSSVDESVTGGSTTNFQFNNVSQGKAYTAVVTALDANNNVLTTATSASASLPTPAVGEVASYAADGSAISGGSAIIHDASPMISWPAVNGATFYYIEAYASNNGDPSKPFWGAITATNSIQVGKQGTESIDFPYLPTQYGSNFASGTVYDLTVTAIKGNTSGSFANQTALDLHRGPVVQVAYSS